jgi:hypothetical protein
MSWNYHTMVSVGSCFLLDRLQKDKIIPEEIRLRLLVFFNGHPYLVPYAISAISKELDEGSNINKIQKFIQSVVGFIGAVGDHYYWNGLKPLFLLSGVLFVTISANGLWLALSSVFLYVLYNFLQSKERINGVRLGLEHGFAVVKDIKEIKKRWGYQHFPALNFYLIIVVSVVLIFRVIENWQEFFIVPAALFFGLLAGKTGNSGKFVSMAILGLIIVLMADYYL